MAEVPEIQSRCRHTRVVVLPLDVDQPEATRVEALLELLLEVAELIDITARLTRIEFADDLSEQTRETPTLDRDVDQGLLHLLTAFRSEEPRVGKECVCTCRSRRPTYT